jgi:proline dehydrogenase
VNTVVPRRDGVYKLEVSHPHKDSSLSYRMTKLACNPLYLHRDKRMVSFDNTEVAFSGKSDKDLRRAYWLFRLVGNPWLVKLGKIFAKPMLVLGFRGVFKRTIFRQFCGGETIEECGRRVEELERFHIGTILDYSVEGRNEEKDLDHTAEEIIATAIVAKGKPFIPFCVFKVTGVARFDLLEKVSRKAELSDEEKKEYLRVVNRVDKICRKAYEADTPVFVDAEESWIQDAIDGITHSMMAKYNKQRAIVFNTLQMYRHDRMQFFIDELEKSRRGGYKMGMKIVRGAYMEKERDRAEKMGYASPIQKDKAATDRDYNNAIHFALENSDQVSICAGTHNEQSSIYLAELMKQKNISPDDKRIYFAQLLGMSDHISYNLAINGFNVAKYVPYGPIREVLPYLIRRAEENTSVKGQTGRELSLIIKERKRRKSK